MENPLYTLPSEQPNLTEEKVRAIVYSMMQNFDGTIKAAAGNVTIQGNSANIIKQDSSNVYGVSATGSDAYLARYNPPIVAYTDGLRLSFKADVANIGAATFTADDLTAKDIRKNGSSALVTGDIVAGQQVDVVYDTTNGWWQLQTPSSALTPTLFNQGQTSRTAATGDGDQTIAHGLGVTPKYIRITASALGTSNTQLGWSIGCTSSTSDNKCQYFSGNNGVAFATGQDTSNLIFVDSGTGTEQWTATLTTLDATNIVLTCDVTGSAGTLLIQWEAFG